jgi:formate dehydrogenase major subunit
MNRRMLYNRASADPDGKPWSERKRYVWWDEDRGTWAGDDVPDFPLTRLRPTVPSSGGRRGGAGRRRPVHHAADGKGWLFAPRAWSTDRCRRTTSRRRVRSATRSIAAAEPDANRVFPRKDNLFSPSAGEPGSEVYPYVFTTYRLTEHHTAGGMSRWLPYLSELQPEMFCEVSPALAAERGLEPYGWATIISARTAIEARVLVTDRMTPLVVRGHTVHQIGLPYHWGIGREAVVSGDAANDLLGVALDPNVQIQESKAGSCDIRPGRRPRGEALLRLVEEYQSRSGATVMTDNTLVTEADAEGHAPAPAEEER